MRFNNYLNLSLTFILFTPTLGLSWEALPESPPIPADNPQTPAKILLGKTLFFDPRLSKPGNISCNSCHNLSAGGDDNRPNSIGMHDAQGERSAPSVWNAAFYSVQFWDGRAVTLEDQAKGPIVNPVEMGMSNLNEAVARLQQISDYNNLFKAAFPDEKKTITANNLAKAIAAFERTLITPNSPYDRYVKGETTALTAQQIQGMQDFSDVGCVSCHSGSNFSGPTLSTGMGFFMKFPTYPGSKYDAQYQLLQDQGRFGVTKQDQDMHLWRVPTLRNIALTAPYFHNGSVPTLQEAIRVMAKTQLNKELTETQANDLVAFLNSLTGEFPELTLPRLPATSNYSIISPDSKL